MIEAFLAAAGFGAAARRGLPGDAGVRVYERLEGGPLPAVLMRSPEDVGPFLAVRARLAALGLSVPLVFAADVAAGLVLMEDFGPALLADGVAGAALAERFGPAVAALAVLACADRAGLPRWGAAEMAAAAAATFLDWWWPAAFGAPAGERVRAAFAAAMAAMLAPVDAGPVVCVHRDYFAGNLFWLPGRLGLHRVGMIDFQDAAVGPAAYDLVSLVQDARRDVPAEMTAWAMGAFLAVRPDLASGFEEAFWACAAARHVRVAGLWVRLARRDGKPGYLAHGPRSWRLLEAALAHRAAAPLRAFMEAHVPAARRGNPAALAA